MNGGQAPFGWLVLASIVIHLALFGLLSALPSGPTDQSITIYTVQIVEAPARPQPRKLALSTDSISGRETPALPAEKPIDPGAVTRELTAPETRTERPETTLLPGLAPTAPSEAGIPAIAPRIPLSPAARPDLSQPAAPAFVNPAINSPAAPSTAPDGAPTPPRAPAPPLAAQIQAEGILQPPPSPEHDNQAKAPSLPELPRLPAAVNPTRATEIQQSPAPPQLAAPPPPPPEQRSLEETAPRSALDSLRKQLDRLPSAPDPPAALEAPRSSPSLGSVGPDAATSNPISLRLFRKNIEQAVRDSYVFPGGSSSFDRNLSASIRVLIGSDGTVLESRVVESSGNERFDKLVCMRAVNTAKFPPFPRDIVEPTLTQIFVCSP